MGFAGTGDRARSRGRLARRGQRFDNACALLDSLIRLIEVAAMTRSISSGWSQIASRIWPRSSSSNRTPPASTNFHGRINGMKCTIDAAGRVVIPKEIRRQAGLGPGTAVDIRFEDGLIEIEPLSVPIQLVREGQLLVARPTSRVPPLTLKTVEMTLDALRRERGGLD